MRDGGGGSPAEIVQKWTPSQAVYFAVNVAIENAMMRDRIDEGYDGAAHFPEVPASAYQGSEGLVRPPLPRKVTKRKPHEDPIAFFSGILGVAEMEN